MHKPIDVEKRLQAKKWVVGDCWRYLGGCNSLGYGKIYYNGKNDKVHRISAHLYLGFDLDSKLNVLHKPICNFRDCWNPEHLYIGTHMDNMSDRSEAKTHCIRGHEFSEMNTSYYRGARICKACKRELAHELRHA